MAKANKNDAPLNRPATPVIAPHNSNKWIIAVMAFTALLYANALTNGFTNYDDDFYILKNPFLADHSFNGIKAVFSSFYVGNYHPLTTLTFLFEYTFFGLNPLPYHFTNVLLHVLNTWLVFRVVLQLSGKQVTALVAAVLFAAHPLHVESVAWVSERKDVLYTFFYLLSIHWYLLYTQADYKPRRYIIALLLFLASLLSKSAAVTLPVLLLAIDIYKGRKIAGKAIIDKIPFFILSLTFGIIAIMSQKAGGAIRDLSAIHSFTERIFIFTYGLSSYLVWLVLPVRLSAMHFLHNMHGGALPWEYYASLPFLLLVGWCILRPSRYRKELVFGAAFFIITISVMLQIIAVGGAVTAERYTYVPYIGFFYVAGQWIAEHINTNRRSLLLIAGSTLLLIFSAITWNRIGVWKSGDTLFTDAIQKDPEAYFGYWMRGNLESGEARYEEALADYNNAIKFNPDFEDLYYDRGHAYFETGQPAQAIKDYTMAITLKPDMAQAYNDRGWAGFKTGDTSNAITDIDRAISLDPALADAYNNRGAIHYSSGNFDKALPDFDKAIELRPAFNLAYFNRAVLRANKRDFQGALADFDALLAIKPDDYNALYSRGLVKYNLKDNTGACADWNAAAAGGNQQAGQLLQQYCR